VLNELFNLKMVDNNRYMFLDKGILKISFILHCFEIKEFKISSLLNQVINTLDINIVEYDHQDDEKLIQILSTLPINIVYVNLQISNSCYHKNTENRLCDNEKIQLEHLISSVIVNSRIKFSGPTQQRLKHLNQHQCTTIKYTYTIYNETDVIPPIVDHLVWKNRELFSVYVGQIPQGVRRITFYGDREIGVGCIPPSVEFIRFKGNTQCLSVMNLTQTNLKYLCFDEKFSQMLHGNQYIPSSVIYLEIYFCKEDYYHWLYSMGTLPSSIKYLKINFHFNFSLFDNDYDGVGGGSGAQQRFKPFKPFLIPKSVDFLYVDNKLQPIIKYIETEEYYQDQQSTISNHECNLKKLSLCSNYQQVIQPNILPTTLTSLDLSKILEPHRIINSSTTIPHSVIDLSCRDYSIIPSNQLFTRLECWALDKIDRILVQSSKPITKEIILNPFTNSDTDALDQIKIIELEVDSFKFKNTKNIDKLIINGNVDRESLKSLPDDLKELVLKFYSLSLPNYPKDLKKLTYLHNYISDPELIPPSIQDLTLALTRNNINLLFNPCIKIETNYSKDIESLNNNIVYRGSNLFFNIWRNSFLKNQIVNLNYINMYAVKGNFDIIKYLNRFPNNLLVLKDDYNPWLKINSLNGLYGIDSLVYYTSLSSVPRGIKYLSTLEIYPIPEGVNHINIGSFQSRQQISNDYFPSTLKKLKVGNTDYLVPVPSTVEYLVLKVSQLDHFKIPPTIKTLEILYDTMYHKVLEDKSLPLTLEKVKININIFQEPLIDDQFIQSLNQRNLFIDGVYEIYKPNVQISNSTTVLIWLQDIRILPNTIPSNVKRIIFGQNFNQVLLKDSLPNSIVEINFGLKFSHCLSYCYLPNSIRYISFSKYIHPFKKDSIPTTVNHIRINSRYLYKSSLFNLPRSISNLEINCQRLSNIPSWIKHLKLFGTLHDNVLNVGPSLCSIQTNSMISIMPFNNDDDINNNVQEQEKKFSLSTNIHIQISDMMQYNGFIRPGTIDTNVKSLMLPNVYNQPIIEGSIPNSVTKLTMGKFFSEPTFFIPSSVKILDLGLKFNSPLTPNLLPSTLEELFLSDSFNQPLTQGILPQSLVLLQFGSQFSQILCKKVLPHGLKKLVFKSGYYDKSILECIPTSLKELEITLESPDKLYEKKELNSQEIPMFINTLVVGGYQPICSIDKLPSNIKSLSLGLNFSGTIPSTIEFLDFNHSSTIKPLHFIFPN